MSLSQSERAFYVVKWLTRELHETQYSLAAKLGYTNHTSLSQILNGKKKVPDNFPERLASLHPLVNVDFLRGTSEDMLLNGAKPGISIKSEESRAMKEMIESSHPAPSPSPKEPKPQGIVIPQEIAAMFSDMAATIRMQQETIQALTNQNK